MSSTNKSKPTLNPSSSSSPSSCSGLLNSNSLSSIASASSMQSSSSGLPLPVSFTGTSSSTAKENPLYFFVKDILTDYNFKNKNYSKTSSSNNVSSSLVASTPIPEETTSLREITHKKWNSLNDQEAKMIKNISHPLRLSSLKNSLSQHETYVIRAILTTPLSSSNIVNTNSADNTFFTDLSTIINCRFNIVTSQTFLHLPKTSTSQRLTIPAEFASVRLTLRNGTEEDLHHLFDYISSDELSAEAIEKSSRSAPEWRELQRAAGNRFLHKISPNMNSISYESYLEKKSEKITKFAIHLYKLVQKRSYNSSFNSERPTLFVVPDEQFEIILGTFEYIRLHINNKENKENEELLKSLQADDDKLSEEVELQSWFMAPIVRYSSLCLVLNELYFEMKEKKKINSICSQPLLSTTKQIIEASPFSSYNQLCPYHHQISCQSCALSHSYRYAYILSSTFCPLFGIKTIPGRQLPL